LNILCSVRIDKTDRQRFYIGVEESVGASIRLGGNAFALFLKNQRRWVSKPYEQKNIDSFQERCEKSGYDPRK